MGKRVFFGESRVVALYPWLTKIKYVYGDEKHENNYGFG
jgi:hypothetical protein